MDSGMVMSLVVLVAVVLVFVYKVFYEKEPIEDWGGAISTVRDAVYLVEKYAPAADQLVSIGAMKKEDRLEYVIDLVLSHLDDMDSKQVRGIVEWWVATQKWAE
jgi:hypothetical protein